jgi:TolB-like protein
MSGQEVRFGRFQLSLAGGGLSRDGAPVSLGSRALEILCVLAAAKGEVVSKDDIMARVWPDRVVEENNLQVHISAVRKALDDGAEGKGHVVTVPGRGYRLIGIEITQARAAAGLHTAAPPDNPSIAVLPFQDMSDQPRHDRLNDAIVEDIITGLSRVQWLSVTARNSSFAYAGRSVDVRQVGRELGVHYVLEGSVRRIGERVRITGQLIDAASGTHVWADNFDGRAEDVFELQDRMTASVISAVEPRLLRAELERRNRKPASSAWDYLARGVASQWRWTRDSNAEALQLFRAAIELDPNLAGAYAMASNSYTWAKSFGWLTDPAVEIPEGEQWARRALDLGRDDGPTLTAAGFALAYLVGDVEVGNAAIDRAVALHPGYAGALGVGGWVKVYFGEFDAALARVERAMGLSPVDALKFAWQSAGSYAHFFSGRHEDALSWAQQALRERPGYLPAERMVAAASVRLGLPVEAQMQRLRALEPALRVSKLNEQIPLQRAEDLAELGDALRSAGVAES